MNSSMKAQILMKAGRWPLPAMGAWAFAWGVHQSIQSLGGSSAWAFIVATLSAAGIACHVNSRHRRLLICLGFPLSALLLAGAQGLPSVAWALGCLALALLYPVRSWSDAPWFPTQKNALEGLDDLVATQPPLRVLDVGCGMGDGLKALHQIFPNTKIEGIEWSHVLTPIARWRCPWATVRQGDMWAQSWQNFDLVYLFQRPESMSKALDKARREMRPGTWLVSLEFEIEGYKPTAVLQFDGRKPVWIYRIPGKAACDFT
jgi:hypothetical protein